MDLHDASKWLIKTLTCFKFPNYINSVTSICSNTSSKGHTLMGNLGVWGHALPTVKQRTENISLQATFQYSWAHSAFTVATNWPSISVESKMMSSQGGWQLTTHNALWAIEGSQALANELWDYRGSLLDCACTHTHTHTHTDARTLALWQIEHNPHRWATASDSRDSKTMTYRACWIKAIPLFPCCLQHLHIKAA